MGGSTALNLQNRSLTYPRNLVIWLVTFKGWHVRA